MPTSPPMAVRSACHLRLCGIREVRARERATARYPPRRPRRHAVRVTCTCVVCYRLWRESTQRLETPTSPPMAVCTVHLRLCSTLEVRAQEHTTARCPSRRPWRRAVHVTCTCAVYERSGCEGAQRLGAHPAVTGGLLCASPAPVRYTRVQGGGGRNGAPQTPTHAQHRWKSRNGSPQAPARAHEHGWKSRDGSPQTPVTWRDVP